jgi:hypothetical protein
MLNSAVENGSPPSDVPDFDENEVAKSKGYSIPAARPGGNDAG